MYVIEELVLNIQKATKCWLLWEHNTWDSSIVHSLNQPRRVNTTSGLNDEVD